MSESKYSVGAGDQSTIPCQNVKSRHPAFDQFANNFRGIKGYRANLFSLYTKKIDINAPNTIRQMTRGEFHGKVVPPNSRPRRSISTSAIIDRLPNQSIALNPSNTGVLGLWTSRNMNNRMNVVPETGRLIQKVHLQDNFWVKTPPRTGPTPPAITQTNSISPI